MPLNSSASVYGGAGGRGAKASVSSLEGLRNVMRNDTERDSPAPVKAPIAPASAPTSKTAAPAPPADDKQTLRGLNDRLNGYLNRVRQLEKENKALEDEIEEILAKRAAPDGRDWDEIQKPLDELKDKIKEITKENAKLLLQIDNTGLANNDLKNKLDEEKKAVKAIEKDVEEQRRTIDETKLKCAHLEKDIELVKNEIEHLKKEHKGDVDDLRDKIKDSEVKVEIESSDSNLTEALNKIRSQYDDLVRKTEKETEDWYQSKFKTIKVEEAKNTEAVMKSKDELKDLSKEKQLLEIKIQGAHTTIHNLEQNVKSTKVEYGVRLGPLNKKIKDLEAELKEFRNEIERQLQKNKDLVMVKMKLEEEIRYYQELMQGVTADPDSLEFSLDDALDQGQPKLNTEPLKREEAEEEVKEETAPSINNSMPEIKAQTAAEG
ncbi:keratin, type I cytoskeletal 18-like [Periophthalmus magnuspinnatus]|uniref:keratin, type I cytoskeletal 18-like n=1 Tax=Periophthalmus magnuspinnatus TaxID=409849 RepID=UPI00145B4E78|nr:keratin, type I cytoskeletal 18-like [Periophthalmus magnuspinnatus]